jgi:hypothetical protein
MLLRLTSAHFGAGHEIEGPALFQTDHIANTVHGLVRRLVDFCVKYPHRFELITVTFGFPLAAKHPMPVYELLKARLTSEIGVDGTEREKLALAIAALILGTTRGNDWGGTHDARSQRPLPHGLGAMRLLLAAFSAVQSLCGNASGERRRVSAALPILEKCSHRGTGRSHTETAKSWPPTVQTTD